MTTKINQKEYLKKYLSGDKKKKKKNKKLKAKATVKIIDDDVHVNRDLEIDEELLLTGEDAPQIVGIINASGEPVESKWKSFSGIKKEEESDDDDKWGKKATNEKRHTDESTFKNPNRLLPARRNSDQSPPRKEQARSKNLNGHNSTSEKRSRWNSDMSSARDKSPPRKSPISRPRKDSDHSPPRRYSPARLKRDSDQSPPRRHSPARLKRDSDQSPPRRHSPARLKRDSDQSPPRRHSPARLKRDSDQSPPRRHSPARLKRDSDQSPPRRSSLARSKKDTDQSPPRRESKSYSKRDSDQSPRRRRSQDRKQRDSDQSPRRRQSPGRKRRNSDQSPPRRTTIKTSDRSSSNRFDYSSGIRIKRENSSDQSPPRRTGIENPFKTSIKIEKPSPDRSPRKRTSESPPPTHKPSSSKMSKTLDGKRAGLQDAQTLRIETEERRRNEDRMYNKMSKEISGRDAEVQVRKNSYRRHRKDIEEDPEVQRQKAEHEEKKKVLYSRWNKGVKQIEAFQAKMSDDQYEGSKPLARYANDADLDEMLRQKERDDDPMLEYIRSKKKDQQLAANIPVMPKYKGSYPENRFGIPPGYRWDGVDRSNGYEKKWFDVQSSKLAVAEEAYKYSVEDM